MHECVFWVGNTWELAGEDSREVKKRNTLRELKYTDMLRLKEEESYLGLHKETVVTINKMMRHTMGVQIPHFTGSNDKKENIQKI